MMPRPLRPPLSLLLVLLAALAAAPAGATSTRILALGGDGDYFEDEHNVLRYYASLPDYPDLGVLELGDVLAEDGAASPARQGGGVHLRLDEAGRWGTGALYLSEAGSDGRLPGTWTAAWARALGGVQLGLLGGWARFAEPDDVWELWQDDWTVGLGLRADLGERAYGDLAVQWRGTTREYPLGEEEESRWDSYAWRARLFVGLRETLALVPVLDHAREAHLAWDAGPPLGGPVALDARLTRLGLGLNVLPDADTMLVISCEQRWGKSDRHDARLLAASLRLSERRISRQVVRLGAETRLLSWLTLRGSVRQEAFQDEQDLHFADGTVDTEERGEPELELALGLGLHLGGLDVDLLVNDEAPFSLGSFLTGAGEEEAVNFTSVTLAYGF